MKYIIRITIAAFTLALVAACAEQAQPPVARTVHGEHTYHAKGK